MKVVVTGASGFVGQALCPCLINEGHNVRSIVRNKALQFLGGQLETIAVGDININTDWTNILSGQDMIIHLAARAHTKEKNNKETERLFHSINVEGTRNLAIAAQKVGIKRFIYVSSVKAMGENSGYHPFHEKMQPKPGDVYGRSKLKAEQELLKIAENTQMEVVIFRPPLIYGPGVKGNFLDLMVACDKRIPLPFKGIENKRSFIFIDNLVDALSLALKVKPIFGETFFISDGENVSIEELVKLISHSLGKKPRLFSVPTRLLMLAGLLSGKTSAVERLINSLEVDDRKIKIMLGWTRPANMLQGLEYTAKWFQCQRHV